MKRQLLVSLLVNFAGLLIFVVPLKARSFSENFAGDFSQWQLLNGQWADWEIINQQARAKLEENFRVTTLVPSDEFWQNLIEYEVNLDFIPMDDHDKTLALGMSTDALNFYDLHFVSGHLQIEDVREGLVIHSVGVEANLLLGQLNYLRVIFRREELKIYLNGWLLHTVKAEDWGPLITGGKFALRNGTGVLAPSEIYFDNLRVYNLKTVNLIKQTTEDWGSEIYDHSLGKLLQPDIYHWGCALTSAVMILNYYGYEFLPDGSSLNPKNLNLWLQAQIDGYIATGLVNWLAISRLSEILSTSHEANIDLPKLEFLPVVDEINNLHTFLKNSLWQNQAVIAHVPNHFLVVDDFDQDRDDFQIKDPFFDYQWLSQHSDLLSLRTFKPSQTDLSYVLLVKPKDFLLTDLTSNEILKTAIKVEEKLTIDGLNTSETEQQQTANGERQIANNLELFYLPKAETQTFAFNLQLPAQISKAALANFNIFAYTQNGEVKVFSLSENLTADLNLSAISHINITFDFDKTTSDQQHLTLEAVEKTADEIKFDTLDRVATEAEKRFHVGDLSFYLFYQLEQLIIAIRDDLNIFHYLEKFLTFYHLNFA